MTGVEASEATFALPERPRAAGRQDWTAWPGYNAAGSGYRGYWYPVTWSNHITKDPKSFTICGEKLAIIRDAGKAYALHDRCPHRGVPLSEGDQQFPGTVSCPYHGWTYRLTDGKLAAVITDGPDSKICGKLNVQTYAIEERLGLVWVYIPIANEPAPSIDDQLPRELVENKGIVGGRIQPREGNWRFACENGFDEGHAKYLHRTALWRLFKPMPTWNITSIVPEGRWIYRVQEEVYWEAEFPGVGTWTNKRWWKKKPDETQISQIGNVGAGLDVNPVIAAQNFPGFASLSMPGVLRIAYPKFIHYEFYVPVDEDNHKYVGLMVNFVSGAAKLGFYAKYLGAIRWLFHGQFSGQDAWMVEVTDAPPEKLYRPDVSLTTWRNLAEEEYAEKIADPAKHTPKAPVRPARERRTPTPRSAPDPDRPNPPRTTDARRNSVNTRTPLALRRFSARRRHEFARLGRYRRGLPGRASRWRASGGGVRLPHALSVRRADALDRCRRLDLHRHRPRAEGSGVRPEQRSRGRDRLRADGGRRVARERQPRAVRLLGPAQVGPNPGHQVPRLGVAILHPGDRSGDGPGLSAVASRASAGVRSNRPTRSRTARCSARAPSYSIGMFQPPNGPSFEPSAACSASSGECFSPSNSSMRCSYVKPPPRSSGWSAGPSMSRS